MGHEFYPILGQIVADTRRASGRNIGGRRNLAQFSGEYTTGEWMTASLGGKISCFFRSREQTAKFFVHLSVAKVRWCRNMGDL